FLWDRDQDSLCPEDSGEKAIVVRPSGHIHLPQDQTLEGLSWRLGFYEFHDGIQADPFAGVVAAATVADHPEVERLVFGIEADVVGQLPGGRRGDQSAIGFLDDADAGLGGSGFGSRSSSHDGLLLMIEWDN